MIYAPAQGAFFMVSQKSLSTWDCTSRIWYIDGKGFPFFEGGEGMEFLENRLSIHPPMTVLRMPQHRLSTTSFAMYSTS